MTLTSVCTNLVSSLNLPINRPGSGGRLDILLLGINRRFTETEMGSFDNGNAHTGIDISANFIVGFCQDRRLVFLLICYEIGDQNIL